MLISFTDKEEIFYTTVEVNKAISLLKTIVRAVLVFLLRDFFKRLHPLLIDLFI